MWWCDHPVMGTSPLGGGEPVRPSRAEAGTAAVAWAPDVVVWEADGRRGHGGYGRAISNRLVRAGFSVSTVPLVERAPDEAELSAPMHVVSGGDTAVDADVPWLDAVRARLAWVLEEALAGRCSVTGICFGAQLIAHVLAGGRATGEHPDGMQAGLVALRRDRPVAVSSFHYHCIRREAVERAGGSVVLDSARTEVQAFRFGSRVRGAQFHPELSPAGLRRTVRTYADVLERCGASVADTARSIADHRRSWSAEPWLQLVERPAAQAVACAS